MEERRRFPRRAMEGELTMVPFAVNVRVLDISVAGVLLHSNRPVPAGTRGRLSLNLQGFPFKADVEVQRVTRAADPTAGYRVGVRFVALSRDYSQHIERFMTQ